MATRKSLTLPSILFVIAGAFELVGFATYFVDNPVQNWNWWTYFLADLALLAGGLFLGLAVRGAARWLLFASALGFLLVCIWILAGLPGPIFTIGDILGALGLLVAAIVLLTRHEIGRNAAIGLIVGAALLVVNYFAQLPDGASLAISVIEGLAFIAAGILQLRLKR